MTKSTFAWIGLGLSLLLLVGFRLAARPTPPHALRQSEVLALVAGQSLPESTVLQIKTREIDFRSDGAYRALLTTAGAGQSVLQALDTAKTVPNNTTNSAPAAATDPADLQHLATAGKAIRDRKFEDANNELDAYIGRRRVSSSLATGFQLSRRAHEIEFCLA
jgi:hypothetical protein